MNKENKKWTSMYFRKWFARFGFFLLVFSFLGLIFGVSLWLSLPSQEDIRGCLVTTMFEVKLCPGTNSYVKFNSISGHLKKAVVAAEDSLFFQHDGFDWESIQYSFEKNMKEGRYVRGGSTITQQLAKNMFLSKKKSLWRKFKEALITKEIEAALKKNEILERYLNVVQFGKGIFGVKQASQFYFKKLPNQLSLNESVFLVFLLPSPEKYSHSFFRKELTSFARRRMKSILSTLYRTGKVSEEEYQVSIDELRYFPGSVPEPLVVENSESNEINKTNENATTSIEIQGDLGPVPTLDQLENEPVDED